MCIVFALISLSIFFKSKEKLQDSKISFNNFKVQLSAFITELC